VLTIGAGQRRVAKIHPDDADLSRMRRQPPGNEGPRGDGPGGGREQWQKVMPWTEPGRCRRSVRADWSAVGTGAGRVAREAFAWAPSGSVGRGRSCVGEGSG
jgi:hypothetical protein